MSTVSPTWIDGERHSQLPLPDRGLAFGDGLFETLLLENNEPLFPEIHWQRLQRGLETLVFPDCLARVRTHCRAALDELRAREWGRAALRITVTRGAGPRGYAPPTGAVPRVIIEATQLPDQDGPPTPASLVCAGIRWGAQPVLAGIKHLNRLEQVLAAAEGQRAGADEALMLDQAGQLISVSTGNLFVVIDGTIHTPLLDGCGIAGTRRRLVIEAWAPAAGYDVIESHLHSSILDRASELFYSNALCGLRPIDRLGEQHWHSHNVFNDLYRQYRREVG